MLNHRQQNSNGLTTGIPKNLMKLSIFLGNQQIYKHKTKVKGYIGIEEVKDSMKLVCESHRCYKILPLGIILK